MTKNSKSQSGFGLVEILIAFIVIAAIGLTAWMVVNKSHKKTPQSSSTTTKPSQPSSPPPKPQDPSENGKYLVIKEWQVRFPLPEEWRGDTEYGIFTFNNGDQAAYFTSKNLASRSEGNVCKLTSGSDSSGQGTSGGTIAVSRLKTKPEEGLERSFYSSGYWYVIEAGNGGACYQGDTGQEKGVFNSMIVNAVKQLEPIDIE